MAQPMYDDDGTLIGWSDDTVGPTYAGVDPSLNDDSLNYPDPGNAPSGWKWDPTSSQWIPDTPYGRDEDLGRSHLQQGDSVAQALAAGVPREFIQQFLTSNRGDFGRIIEAYESGRKPGAASNWFGQNAPSFGGAPSAFGESYTAGTYTPGVWGEEFTAPDKDAVLRDPGYLARLDASQRGAERMAAAKGSVLSGGFIGRTLPRMQQEIASEEYGNAFNRAYDTYQQRYGQFRDAEASRFGAFGANEAGQLNQYNTRYRSYLDLLDNTRRSEVDRWQREMDLSRLGLDATTAGR